MRLSQVYSCVDRCAGLLWPPRCVLCRGAGQPPATDLCHACESEFAVISNPCERCGLPLTTPAAADTAGCDRCRGLALPYARCLAPWAYEFPVTQLVQALKYEGALAHARIFGAAIAAAGERALAGRDGAEAPWLVPMPLHPSRLVERGYNQSREIGRIVARRLDLPLVERALCRVRATAPQVGLDRHERAHNLAGAFVAAPRLVAGRTIILLDDVVTTGSTAAVAAQSLLDAGAASVQVWAAARALG